jgi:hypothetical protein
MKQKEFDRLRELMFWIIQDIDLCYMSWRLWSDEEYFLSEAKKKVALMSQLIYIDKK